MKENKGCLFDQVLNLRARLSHYEGDSNIETNILELDLILRLYPEILKTRSADRIINAAIQDAEETLNLLIN